MDPKSKIVATILKKRTLKTRYLSFSYSNLFQSDVLKSRDKFYKQFYRRDSPTKKIGLPISGMLAVNKKNPTKKLMYSLHW